MNAPPTNPPAEPTPEPAPAELPELKGELRLFDAGFVLTNKDKFTWRDCVIKVNPPTFGNGYVFHLAEIRSRQSRTLPASEFANSEGERFDMLTHKASHIFISCQIPGGHSYTGWVLSDN